MKTNFYINFGGFYYSIHSANIDIMIEQYEEPNETDGTVIEFDNYNELCIEYSKEYVEFLNELLNTDIDFISLESPKFYNYSTDKIKAEISKEDVLKVFKYIKENDLKIDITERIKEVTTSVSGYIPFYSYEDIFKHENIDILIQCIFDVICNNTGEEFLNYYDRNYMYELIYQY